MELEARKRLTQPFLEVSVIDKSSKTLVLGRDVANAQQYIAELEEALGHRDRVLVEIATKSPPDDWEWYEGAGVHAGYGRRGDPDYVEEPDSTNSDDMHSHGWACGQWSAAKIARKALAATERRKEG